jgi:outer membrane lipase/esterase
MSSLWMRRGLLALVSASALLIAACGSGTIESQLQPTRILVFGDGLSDLGQGGTRYTVNDGGVNIWTQHVAASFGSNLTSAAAGGTSWARGNVRITSKPDAAGDSATPTVTEQIDAFLAAGTIGDADLVIVGGGTADIVAEMAKVTSGAQTGEQMVANVQQAGRDLAAQVRRLVAAGGKHVVVTGTYDLGRSPWAIGVGQGALISRASSKFNEEMLVSIVDLGGNVLFVDLALLYNLMIAVPSAYDMVNAIDPVCTSVDPGPGIGIGAGQVNSALCTPSTVVPGVNYNQFVFADRVYPAPQAQRKFGEYAFTRIRARW